ncbi:MAG: hypothetical protein ACTIIZ_10880 [Levilactobacillus brevis]
MSASTEAILIDLIFGLGALIVIAGLIGLLFSRRHKRSLRPMMSVILCGVGIAVIALLLNNLLFKTYAQLRVKKTQYYEITSLTTNMHQSLASSRTPHQPISSQAKKASRNVTYLVKHTNQTTKTIQLAQQAQHSLASQYPQVTLVRHNYRLILNRQFATLTTDKSAAKRASHHAYQQVIHYN